MTAPVLADALGPKARRRVALASVLSAVLVALVVLVAVRRLADKGQLDAERWSLLTDGRALRFLWDGLLATLRVAAVAMALSVAAGAVLALGRLSRSAPLRWAAGAYVELFRALPLLLLIYFAGFGLPKLGVDLPLFWYLVLGLVAYNSAVLGEVFRAGILSLDRGQSEAAYAVGLTHRQAMALVVAPQAARRMAPTIVSQLVILLKDTSLGFVLPFEELLRRGQLAGEDREIGRPLLQALVVVAAIYVVVNLALGALARRLELRQRRRYSAGAVAPTGGPEDLAVLDAQVDAAPPAPTPAARR